MLELFQVAYHLFLDFRFVYPYTSPGRVAPYQSPHLFDQWNRGNRKRDRNDREIVSELFEVFIWIVDG